MRDLETFKLLNRYRFARSNFIAAYHGGSAQNRKRELGELRKQGLLAAPIEQQDISNYSYSPRVYELTDKSKAVLKAEGIPVLKWTGGKHFFHRLMIADILLAIEIACKERGLTFRTQQDIIGSKPLTFDAKIRHQFKEHSEPYTGALEPDALFAINNTCFLLEADRNQMGINVGTFKTSSYLRKLLQYREILKSGSYKKLIPNMFVLNITTSMQHATNIKTFLYDEKPLGLDMKSASLLFKGMPVFASRHEYADPYTHFEKNDALSKPHKPFYDHVAGGIIQTLLDEPFERAGYDPLIISNEVKAR